MSALSRMRRPAGLRIPRFSPRAHPRLVAGALGLVLVLAGLGMWARDSPLVAVQRVTITGLSGPDAPAIRSALIARAHTMTTLDVNNQALLAAVAPYPAVKGLQVSTQFPHGMSIVVHEELPVGAVLVNGRTMPVANDGTILSGGESAAGLPLISLGVPPAGHAVSDPQGAAQVALLAAAPSAMLARLASVDDASPRGLVAKVRLGPELIFGGRDQLVAKWSAAIAVLADAGAAGATYIDVSDPGRPAAGGGPAAAAAVKAATSAAAAAAAGGAATSASPGTGASGASATGSSGAASAGTSGSSSAAATGASGSGSTGSSGAGSSSASGTSGAGSSGGAGASGNSGNAPAPGG